MGMSAKHSFRWRVPLNVAVLLASTALTPVTLAGTLPQGGTFQAGNGSITSNGADMAVNQSSNRAIITWNSFSIGNGNSVQFNNGPGATLNRVTGTEFSSILGSLKATGTVYLVNPNGVVIGSSGVVVSGGSFVASTADVLDQAFMAGGTLLFKGNSNAEVHNLGRISSTGGDVFLIARSVVNDGVISAPKGGAGLIGGQDVLLAEKPLDPDSPQAMVNAGVGTVTNTGLIEAAQAELRAAGGNIYALAGNNQGAVRATGSENRNGRIWLIAQTGDVANSGTLKAQNADGSGGAVVVQSAGTTTHSGTIDATGSSGGDVRLLGQSITVASGGVIDASGRGNGGKVFIGGDVRGGADPAAKLTADALPNAQMVTVAKDAVVRADGGTQGGAGTGGSIVVWSDRTTEVAGRLSARGGKAGGDGGFVETSGHGTLRVLGTVDVSAAAGKGGSWLLDPANVDLFVGEGDTIGGTSNVYTADWSGLDLNSLTAALAGGANVTIQTNSGDICFARGVTFSAVAPVGGASLTLKAAGSVAFGFGSVPVEFDVGAGSGDFTLSMQANATGGSAGRILFQKATLWNYGAGKFNVNMDAGNGYILLIDSTKIHTGGGNISLTAGSASTGRGITIGDTELITGTDGGVGSGTITLNGTGSIGGVYVGGASVVVANSISITGTSATDSAVIIGGTAQVAGTVKTAGGVAGTVTMEGTGTNGVNLIHNSVVRTNDGTLTLTGHTVGNPDASNGNNNAASGVLFSDNALVQSGTGAITISGDGDIAVATRRNFGISMWGGRISSSGGGISLTGTAGGDATTNTNDGIYLDNSAVIQSLGSTAGAITLVGTGRGADSDGIRMAGLASVLSEHGNISMTGHTSALGEGQGGTVGVNIVNGASVLNTSSVASGTAGKITIAGDATYLDSASMPVGHSTGDYNMGVNIGGGAATVVRAAGQLSITGTGGGYGSNGTTGSSHNHGVLLASASTVGSATDVTIVGTGGHGTNPATDGNVGTYITGGRVEATGNGTIHITGTGGPSDGAAYNHGVLLINDTTNAVVTSANGDIVINGHGHGLYAGGFLLRNGAVVSAHGAGALTITADAYAGTGANDATGSTDAAQRVDDVAALRMSSGTLSTEDGRLTLVGTNTSNAGNSPVDPWYSVGIRIQPQVTIKSTGTGDISITGTGGGGTTSGVDYGVVLYGQVLAQGSGNISITGTAGPAGSGVDAVDNYGVYIGLNPAGYLQYSPATTADASIQANGGNITITGINNSPAAGADNISQAIGMDANGRVATSGSGTIQLVGQGTAGTVSATNLTTSNTAIGVRSDRDIILSGAINAGSAGGVVSLAANASAGGSASVQDTATAAITASGLVLQGDATSYDLTLGHHSVRRLAADTGSLSYRQAGALAVDSVTNSSGGTVNGITTTGATRIVTAGTNSTLSLNRAISAGSGIVLSSDTAFINNVGANGLSVGGGSRWLVYSIAPSTDTKGGLSGDDYYGFTYAANAPGTIPGTDNRFLYAGTRPATPVPSITIPPVIPTAPPSVSGDRSGSGSGTANVIFSQGAQAASGGADTAGGERTGTGETTVSMGTFKLIYRQPQAEPGSTEPSSRIDGGDSLGRGRGGNWMTSYSSFDEATGGTGSGNIEGAM